MSDFWPDISGEKMQCIDVVYTTQKAHIASRYVLVALPCGGAFSCLRCCAYVVVVIVEYCGAILPFSHC